MESNNEVNELVEPLMKLTGGDTRLKECLNTFLNEYKRKIEIEDEIEKDKTFWSRAYAINGIGLYHYIRNIEWQVHLDDKGYVRFPISEYSTAIFLKDMAKSNDFRDKLSFKQALDKLSEIKKLPLSDLLTKIETFLGNKNGQ